MTTKTRPAYIVRKFKDAGTEQSFAAGSVVELDAGVFANYERAGLVRHPTAEDKRTAKAAPETEAPAS